MASGSTTQYVYSSSEFDVPGVRTIGQKPFGGKIDENVVEYTQQFERGEDQRKERLENAKNLADSYYTLVTDFLEYGYGQSFHFAPVFDGKSLAECIAEYERGVGKTLGAKPGMKLLDVGCGVGGPAREIAKFTGAHVVGVNCCDYQLQRASAHTQKAGLQDLCSYVKGDFLNMTFDDNTFDGGYAFEATCHADDEAKVYSEVYRVLKPGAFFVDSAWALTDNYDPNNPEHTEIKEGICLGSGIPELRSQQHVIEAMRKAGFEVIEFKNAHREGDYPWYTYLEGQGYCSCQSFRTSTIGRWATHIMVTLLETLRIAPKGTTKVHTVLCTAASNLIASGKLDIFTPAFRIVGRKPLD